MPFLTDLADKLRAYTAPDGSKLAVVEVDGWKTRGFAGQGMSSASGAMHHHTATALSAFARSDCPTLGLLVNGRSDLPGPLCHIAFGRSGTVYVVAAGVANHAGPGRVGNIVNTGNHYTIGIEAESSGVTDDWTAAQRRVWPHLGAALEIGYGTEDFLQIGHKEYSSMGKIDPAFIDMDKLRADINDLLYTGGGAASVPTPAETTPERSWLEMATKDELKDALREVLSEPIKREGGESGHTSIITETAWRTARDNRLERRLNVIGARVYHLWADLRLGVAGRVHDGALGGVLRKLGYNPDSKTETARAEAFKAAEKKEWI